MSSSVAQGTHSAGRRDRPALLLGGGPPEAPVADPVGTSACHVTG